MSTFTADLARFAEKTEAEIMDVIEAVAIELYNRVTKKTPVDTGRARANWNISANRLDLTVTEDTTRKAVFNIPGLKGGKDNVIWITNNLEYVYYLDKGSSEQAPEGMVTSSLSEIRAWVKRQLL